MDGAALRRRGRMMTRQGWPWGCEADWPEFVAGPVRYQAYDGVNDDLLTGGLGVSGLTSLTMADLSRYAEPLRPTVAEMRRAALWSSWFGLIDRTAAGGFGRLFGPAADGAGADGRIAGVEYTARAGAAGGGTGDGVTMVVQVPASFSPHRAVIVAAASSGSRGVYGAVPVVGPWALSRGFALALTDKGTGSGFHDLSRHRAQLVTGEWGDADALGDAAHFAARLDAETRAAFVAARPHRFAVKHAHSMRNPEAHWGEDVLRVIRFAFAVLNRHCGSRGGRGDVPVRRGSTLVIAAGVSNGGAAALRAAEQDWAGLIDGVVASEPAVQPRSGPSFVITQGDREQPVHSLPLLDYMVALHVFQPCASLAASLFRQGPTSLPGGPASPRKSASVARAEALRRLGVLHGDDHRALARAAQRWLNERVGLLPEVNALQPLHHYIGVPEAICVSYANAYGRFPVTDALAGYSFASVDANGRPAPLPAVAEAALYGVSTGIPPTAGITIINDRTDGGHEDRSSTPDQNLDGALTLYRLVTGRDLVSGAPVEGAEAVQHRRIRIGIEQVQASGRLRGVPAIIVNGRADAVVAPNHASRGYVGLHCALEGEIRRLSYCEVVDAHHFDAWNGLFPVLAARYVPLQPYLEQALDRMLDHLRAGRPLPPSQVVRSHPRGVADDGSIPPLDATQHLPPLRDAPDGDGITYAEGRLAIPD